MVSTTSNLLTFGSIKSDSTTADSSIYGPLGGQEIIFRGGPTRVNSIQIGNNLFGGNTGSGIANPPTGGTGLIPEDGVFKLLEIHSRQNEQLHYIMLEINGILIEAGSPDTGNVVLSLPSGLPVTLQAIIYNSSQINQLQFKIVT